MTISRGTLILERKEVDPSKSDNEIICEMLEDSIFAQNQSIRRLRYMEFDITSNLFRLHALPNHHFKKQWLRELKSARASLIHTRSRCEKYGELSEDIIRAWLWTYPFETQEDIDFLYSMLEQEGYPANPSEFDRNGFSAMVERYIKSIVQKVDFSG